MFKKIKSIITNNITGVNNLIINNIIGDISTVLLDTRDGFTFLMRAFPHLNKEIITELFSDNNTDINAYQKAFDNLNISFNKDRKSFTVSLSSDIMHKAIIIDLTQYCKNLLDINYKYNSFYELKQLILFNLDRCYFKKTYKERISKCDSNYEIYLIEKLCVQETIY